MATFIKRVVYFFGTDFSGQNFSGQNFPGQIFRDKNFRDKIFRDKNFQDKIFRDKIFRDKIFRDKFSGTNFPGQKCKFSYACLNESYRIQEPEQVPTNPFCCYRTFSIICISCFKSKTAA